MGVEDQFFNIPTKKPEKKQDDFEARFHKQYTHREKMTYVCQEGKKEVERAFEFIDIHPDEQRGKDVYIAVGTPWDWSFMEDFAREIVKAGHRVMAIDHPNAGLIDSVNYKPEIRRPAAMQAFFEKKNLKDITVIAHSVGFIDTMLKDNENISGVVAINPAGLSENSRVEHWLRSIKSIQLAVSTKHWTEDEKKNYRKMVKIFSLQSPFRSVGDVHHVGNANVSNHAKKFKEESVPIITFRNVDDTLVPIDKVFAEHQDYRKLETGGNHLGPFTRPDQMQEVLKAIDEIEHLEK